MVARTAIWRVLRIMVPALAFIGCTMVPVIPERVSLRATFDQPSASEIFDFKKGAEALGKDIELASDSVNYAPTQRHCSKGRKHPLIKFLKQIENTIDDPIDDIKHKLHGAQIMGHRLYLPSFLMKGGSNTCRAGASAY